MNINLANITEETVDDAIVAVATAAFINTSGEPSERLAAAIAAVAPIIRAQEANECVQWLQMWACRVAAKAPNSPAIFHTEHLAELLRSKPIIGIKK